MEMRGEWVGAFCNEGTTSTAEQPGLPVQQSQIATIVYMFSILLGLTYELLPLIFLGGGANRDIFLHVSILLGLTYG